MDKIRTTVLAATFAVGASAASSAPINLDTTYSFAFGGQGTDIFGTAGTAFTDCLNPACVPSPAGVSFEFTLAGTGTLTVLDLFESTDRFEIFNFGASLGTTSAPTDGGTCGADFTCGLADPSYSRGIFALGPGSYSISGQQTEGIAGAGAFIVETGAIPLPTTLPLLLAGLGGLALARRRQRG